ncbi:MAG: alpha/beta fold hydrolase [Pyrinomonadaceae bacterium]
MLPPYSELGSGPPVVLIHAFPLSRSMWAETAAAVARAGFRVITPDHRGFGENSSLADIHTMDEMASDVRDLLDHLSIPAATVGGLSMGGYVTMALYRLDPRRFTSLMLFDTTAAADTEEKRNGRFELIGRIESEGVGAVVEAFLPKLIGVSTMNSQPELAGRIEQWIRNADPNGIIAALRGMADRADSTTLLERVSVPTLLIFGEEDEITGRDAALGLTDAIPHAACTTIVGSGHLSNLERPDPFNSAVIDHLESISK